METLTDCLLNYFYSFYIHKVSLAKNGWIANIWILLNVYIKILNNKNIQWQKINWITSTGYMLK